MPAGLLGQCRRKRKVAWSQLYACTMLAIDLACYSYLCTEGFWIRINTPFTISMSMFSCEFISMTCNFWFPSRQWRVIVLSTIMQLYNNILSCRNASVATSYLKCMHAAHAQYEDMNRVQPALHRAISRAGIIIIVYSIYNYNNYTKINMVSYE